MKSGGQIDFENNSASGSFDFPETDENTRAAAFYTTGRFRSNEVCMPLTPMFHAHTRGFPEYSDSDRYVFTDAIPKTSVGKLDKKVLRKHYK